MLHFTLTSGTAQWGDAICGNGGAERRRMVDRRGGVLPQARLTVGAVRHGHGDVPKVTGRLASLGAPSAWTCNFGHLHTTEDYSPGA